MHVGNQTDLWGHGGLKRRMWSPQDDNPFGTMPDRKVDFDRMTTRRLRHAQSAIGTPREHPTTPSS